MGDLPMHRIVKSNPFTKIGIDFAGPFLMKPNIKRSKVKLKSYVALFVCFCTKAIHIEIVSDLSSAAFLAALKRFISRRGKPSDIFSDNGTNFRGANNILREHFGILKASTIQKFISNERINWHFIPPSAPNFGGIWEAGIKSFKFHLLRCLKSQILTFEELSTLTTQIEACLNSRPICPPSSDSDDFNPLTPGHFLIGRPLTALPESNDDDAPINYLDRWRLNQKIKNVFWKRWNREYLNNLQQRLKWQNTSPNIKKGDLILLKDTISPPAMYWNLGRITKVFPGADGKVRVVEALGPDRSPELDFLRVHRMPGHRKRRQFKQTDAFTRGMVIGLKRAGWSIRQIAADTHLGASTVHRLWRRWLEQGNVAIYRNVGATRVTSARVDRRILRKAVAAPQATCTAILQHVQDTLDNSISTRTISRRLVANGLHSCRPLRRLPLTPPNRHQRLEWCRARSTWMTEWHRVVFSDESRFCLSSDSRRVRVWRRRGERSNPAAIVERPTVRQRGIMVWGAIAYDSRSPLLRIQGTMTAQRYVDDVLRPVTLPYLQGVPNTLYQQDNARPHTARISQQALQDVQMLPWAPYSPDLSPIEHVWDIIGRRLHALPQPRSEDELWQMVEREWRAIPQDAIRTLIDSLPKRVAASIAVRGGPTCY
ncbi:hypothetical protein LAZ67_4001500 [Cordylochernes scorpioides]|uniref:Integrase catalytic domain-containing protein n=1 Tax=Cordylochernes scorpioides TaxID=51811 RepID=A0ABY6KD20_9ARAC|nr:hypothetical protein LAZ67_4001500 [Cordylochernes scorpioides]